VGTLMTEQQKEQLSELTELIVNHLVEKNLVPSEDINEKVYKDFTWEIFEALDQIRIEQDQIRTLKNMLKE